MSRTRSLLLMLSTLALSLTACGGADGVRPAAASSMASIELSQRSLTLGVGSSVPLEARVLDGSGKSVSAGVVFWSSSAPEVARVSAVGIVSAITEGRANIAATLQGRSAVATVTVAPTAAAAVRLDRVDIRLRVGEYRALQATVVDGNGATLSGRVVTWRSSNAGVAAVDSTGRITSVGPGAATIVAECEGRTATASVTVDAVTAASISLTPPSASLVEGQSTQLSAEVRDAAGRPLGGRLIGWSTSAPTRVTVTSTGQVTAIAAGTATITATTDGTSATTQITVVVRPVSSLVVSPSALSMISGQRVTLSVLVTDVSGGLLRGRDVSFATANGSVAQVAADGTVTALAAGSTIVTVSSEGKTFPVPVNVAPVPAATIRVAPVDASLTIGERTTLTATVLDAAGSPLARAVAWSSGAPSVASVDANGEVLAVGVGSAVILASTDGRVGSAVVTVRAVPIGSVSIAPTSVALDVNASATFTAVVRNTAGATIQDRVILWTSSDAAVATVNGAGGVTAVGSGSALITAAVDGITGTAAVSVSRPETAAVGRVTVSPATATLKWTGATSRSVRLSATAFSRAIGGTVLPNAEFIWRSSDPSVATVSPTGMVTAIDDGTVTITASSGATSGAAVITVTKK